LGYADFILLFFMSSRQGTRRGQDSDAGVSTNGLRLWVIKFAYPKNSIVTYITFRGINFV